MNRLRLNIGPRLVLCFALIILSMLVGDVIVLWQFHIVQAQAERLNEYDEELVTVLHVHSDLLKFRDALESLANAKDAERLKVETQSMNEAFAEDMRQAKNALLAVDSDNASDPTNLPTLAVIQSTLRSQTASMTELAEADDWNALQMRLDQQVTPTRALRLRLGGESRPRGKDGTQRSRGQYPPGAAPDFYRCAGHGRYYLVDCRSVGTRDYPQHHTATGTSGRGFKDVGTRGVQTSGSHPGRR